MSHIDPRQKAFDLLADASRKAEALHQQVKQLAQDEEEFDKSDAVFFRQREIDTQVRAAEAYALLAANSPLVIGDTYIDNPVLREEPPVPEEDREGEETRDSFAEFLGGDPLDMLERVIEVGRIFTKPRPVKDSPQA